MKESRKKLIWTARIVLFFALVHYYLYPPLNLVQFGNTQFPLKEIWSQKLDGNTRDITIIESKSLVIVRTSNKIFALDKNQGNVIWQFSSPHVSISAPAVFNGLTLFINDNQSLWAIRPEDGQVLWSQPLNSYSTWIPDASERIVLVNELGRYVRAYDTQSGSLLWSIGVTTGSKPSFIKDDLVYIVDYGVKAVDALTGKILWSERSVPVRSATYLDGVVYYTPGNKIVAFDVTSRKELWSHDLYTEPDSVTVINNYIMTTTQLYFRAYDRLDGHLVWEMPIELPTNPSAIDNKVYVRDSYTVKIRAFDIDSGQDAGSIRIAFPWFTIEKRDLVSSGNMLFFSRGNELFAFEK